LTAERGPWREWVDDPPGPPPPARVNDGRLRVTFVNHATTLIQMDGVNILTDPIWSERCSPVSWAGPKRHRPPGIRFEDLPPIDAVLISHNHYDHLDLPTLRRLLANHGDPESPGALTRRSAPPSPAHAGEGTLLLVSHLGNGALLAKHGIDEARELDWWQELPLANGVRVTSVPAQHFSARAISDRDANLWGGFVISGPSGNVYFAGDTGWGRHFAEIGQRFSPIRLALLPIGAYLPRWFMKPAHISPAEAVDAHLALGASTSIPIHFGTFALGDDGEMKPIVDLRAAIAAKGNPNFPILGFGEGRDIP
ncbi:MAG TPA: MBL fold metallo-hydrolase, partial [Thermoanaerobaculia bacterium]|nr:MBL fold metallo-hydrolase [Thermoanaerobaculia bacterium]